MSSQKYWLLVGTGIPALILLLGFARFSHHHHSRTAFLASLTSKSSVTPVFDIDIAPKSSSTSTAGLHALQDRVCVADTVQTGAEVRALEDSGSTAGAVIGKVRPGAQITQIGGIQTKNGQENTIEVVPISFKRKDLLAEPESGGDNSEELIKAVMWKVVFDQATRACQ